MFENIPWWVWLIGGMISGALLLYFLVVKTLLNAMVKILSGFWKGF